MADSFDAKAIHYKLERLRRKGNIRAVRVEMLKPWPSMKDDISIIYDEIVFELRKNGTALGNFLRCIISRSALSASGERWNTMLSDVEDMARS